MPDGDPRLDGLPTAEIIALQFPTKRCPECNETKPRSEFYSSKGHRDGCAAHRKPCGNRLRIERYRPQTRIYQRGYQKRARLNLTPEERADVDYARWLRYLWQRHGLTMVEVRALLAKQSGLCGNRACGKELSLDVHGKRGYWERAVIDHCHKTGRVRGLLCNPCNKAEGFYTKNKNLLLGIAEYLERTA